MKHKSVMLTNIDFFDSFKKLKQNQNVDQAFEGRALEQKIMVEEKYNKFKEKFEKLKELLLEQKS